MVDCRIFINVVFNSETFDLGNNEVNEAINEHKSKREH